MLQQHDSVEAPGAAPGGVGYWRMLLRDKVATVGRRDPLLHPARGGLRAGPARQRGQRPGPDSTATRQPLESRTAGCTSWAPTRSAAGPGPDRRRDRGRPSSVAIPAVLYLARRRLGDRHVGGLPPRLARDPRDADRRRDPELPVASDGGRRPVRVLAEPANIVIVLAITRIPIYLRTARAESAELQSRVFVDAARTFGAGSLASSAAMSSHRAADAADGRHARLLLRHARRVVAELPRHRHPGTRRQLGSDGRPGAELAADRMVALLLPGPGHRHRDGVRRGPRRLGPAGHRSRSAVAAHRPAAAASPRHPDRHPDRHSDRYGGRPVTSTLTRRPSPWTSTA